MSRRLPNPVELGKQIGRLPIADQALIVDGWLEGPPADVMVRMRSIATELRADPWCAHIPDLASAVEHLLHALRDLDSTQPKE